MTSAAALTQVVKPFAMGPGLLVGVYSYLFPNPNSATGNTVDFTTDFDYVYGIDFIGNDTLADNGYHFGAIVPAPTVACTSSNVLIDVHQEKNPGDSGGADIAFPVVGAVDLSAIGQLMLVVYGA
jgi:hypothetical protein